MLTQSMCQFLFLNGLNFLFLYFCMHNTFTRGYSKFNQVDFDEFTLLSLPTNLFFRFC
jgi:hypothetical protein